MVLTLPAYSPMLYEPLFCYKPGKSFDIVAFHMLNVMRTKIGYRFEILVD